MTSQRIPLSNVEKQKRYRQNPDNKEKIKTRNRNFKEQLKQKGFCRVCYKVQAIENKSYCISCKEKNLISQKEKRAECRQKGICEQCCAKNALKNTNLTYLLCETCYFKKVARNCLNNQSYWETLKEKLESQSYMCPYTGEKLILGVNDSLDHIKPIKHFPELKHTVENVEWTTRAVNEMKRDRTPEQFLSFIQHIISYRQLSDSELTKAVGL